MVSKAARITKNTRLRLKECGDCGTGMPRHPSKKCALCRDRGVVCQDQLMAKQVSADSVLAKILSCIIQNTYITVEMRIVLPRVCRLFYKICAAKLPEKTFDFTRSRAYRCLPDHGGYVCKLCGHWSSHMPNAYDHGQACFLKKGFACIWGSVSGQYITY
jgi:hypothetical protein